MDGATRGRLHDEHDQLAARRGKLEAFILTRNFEQLDDTDRADLREQLTHMTGYERVLERRILRPQQWSEPISQAHRTAL